MYNIITKSFGYWTGLFSSVKLCFTVKNRRPRLIQLLMLFTLIAAAVSLPACSKKTTRRHRRTKPGSGRGRPGGGAGAGGGGGGDGGDYCDEGTIEYESSYEEGSTTKEAIPDRFVARASMKTGTTAPPLTLSTPTSVYLEKSCYYIYYYCMKYEKTGKMCLKGPYWQYRTVNSGCELHYLNCIELYDVWLIAYMGECWNYTVHLNYRHERYPYLDDYFLDTYYVLPEDHVR